MDPWWRDLLPLGGVVLGAFLSYAFTYRGAHRRMVLESRIQNVTEFLGAAYYNLRYIVTSEEAREAQPGDFSVLGERAALFVSAPLAERIDAYTSRYASALTHLASGTVEDRDPFPQVKAELDALRDAIKTELRVLPSKRTLRIWGST